MKRIGTKSWILASLLIALTSIGSIAQEAENQPPPEEPAAEAQVQVDPELESPEVEPDERAPEIVRFGTDYTVGVDERVEDLVVMGGSATIEGQVTGDAVVIGGAVNLASTSVIEGELTVIGGSVSAAPGAVVDGDLVVIGGTVDSPAGFAPGGEQVVMGSVLVGNGLQTVIPWATRGLFFGRLIVPDLGWVWGVVGILFLVYLALNLVFDGSVGACARTLADKPLSAFLVGLLVLVLTGPVSFLLAVSVVGLPVMPFLLCALLVAGILGKVGVSRWIGGSILRQESAENRLQSALSLTIGFLAISLAYMVPVLGIVAWTTLSTLGLGAAALAVVAGLRQENPAPIAPGGPRTARFDEPAGAPSDDEAETVSPGIAPLDTASDADDLTLFPHATFLSRLGAFVLDFLLVLLTFALLGLDNFGRFLLLLLVYHIVFWSWKGTTVGGIICQLRLVRTDGGLLRSSDALVRGLSSIFSLAVLGLGFLWVLMDAERQAWHDKIAGTYVVKVPRNFPLR